MRSLYEWQYFLYIAGNYFIFFVHKHELCTKTFCKTKEHLRGIIVTNDKFTKYDINLLSSKVVIGNGWKDHAPLRKGVQARFQRCSNWSSISRIAPAGPAPERVDAYALCAPPRVEYRSTTIYHVSMERWTYNNDASMNLLIRESRLMGSRIIIIIYKPLMLV